MATATAELLDEAGLVRRAQQGDRDAFLALYQAYSTRIFDFCLRMVRNRADAEDVTSDVFLKAMERLGTLKDAGAFKGWLYAIARNAALSSIERKGKVTNVADYHEDARPTEETPLPDPEVRTEEADLQRLVWDAAATLNPRDYSVFELAIRHGLRSAEIADALEVRPAYAYILVNRLKSSISEALEAMLIARTGRRDCAELDGLIAGYGEDATPRLRKAVSRHAKSCDACKKTRAGRASVPNILQGTAWADPSSGFSETLSRRISENWGTRGPHIVSGGAQIAAQTAGQFIASVAVMIIAAGFFVGVGAQRSIHEVEEVPVRPAAEVEEAPAPSDEAPAPQPGPRIERPQFDGTVIITDPDAVDEGETTTDQDVDSDQPPPPAEPRDEGKPQDDDPPPSEPPIG